MPARDRVRAAPLARLLRLPRPPDIAPLDRFFGAAELAFGAESSGFVLPRAALDAPTRAADPRLLATAVDLAEAALVARPSSRSLASLVADRLRTLLPEASLEAVAEPLKMSPRTLQRRLEQEGTRFAEVLDGVRQGLARGLVKETALPLSEIAFRLVPLARSLGRLRASGTRLIKASSVRPKTCPVFGRTELGFADLATFSRAFKRWTGAPPGAFRRA